MPKLLPPGERERRRRVMAPLLAYCDDRGISRYFVLRRACMRQGVEPYLRQRMTFFAQGICVPPAWFIPQCCAVVGQSVEAVMGAAWVRDFGAEFGGLSERRSRDAS